MPGTTRCRCAPRRFSIQPNRRWRKPQGRHRLICAADAPITYKYKRSRRFCSNFRGSQPPPEALNRPEFAGLKSAACGLPPRRAYRPYRRCGRVAEGGGLLNRYRVVKPYRGFESLRLRQPLIAWARRAAMERNRSRYRAMAAKQRRRAGLHFMLRSRDILRPPDHLVSHYEQIDALVLLPILEINETGTE